MIMKLCMEQYVLMLYKVYINDDPELTLTHLRQCQNWRNLFCTNSRPRYQVSVYRTIGPLVFNISAKDPHLKMHFQVNYTFAVVFLYILLFEIHIKFC